MPWILIQTVSFAAGLTGLLLVVLGLVGKRSGAGVRCRSCGYDVEAIADEQDRCPECGSSIAGKGETVRGARVRRRGVVAAGAILLAPSVAAGWYVSSIIQPVTARPSWLMAVELTLGPTSENADLARELDRRWRRSSLNWFSRRALVGWGLSAWNGPHESRTYAHASIVWFAVASGELSPEQIDRFVEQVLIDVGDETSTARQKVALAVAEDFGTAVRSRLESALDRPDLRDAAIGILLNDLRNTPSDRLTTAAVQSLGHRAGGAETGPALDRLPMSIEAQRAARFLSHHAPICAPALRTALNADDPQRRLLAALALTEARDSRDAQAIGIAVASAFERNTTPGDAVLASRALLRAGPVAADAASAAVTTPAARRRVAEISAALANGRLPPTLERLAGRLPWQSPSRQRTGLVPRP
ncbi:MAG: hypothetical protein AAF937_03095 [Planctomycetota bacterium]